MVRRADRAARMDGLIGRSVIGAAGGAVVDRLALKLDNLTDTNWTVLGSNRRLCLIVVYRA